MKKYILFTFSFLLLFSCKFSQKEEKISVIGENAANLQAMMALEKDYEKNHSEIDLDFKPNNYDDAFNKSNQDFANGTGLYDIIMQYNFSLSSFVENNYVYPLDILLKNVPDSLKSFEKELYPRAWKEVGFYSSGDKQTMTKVGYPFASNTMILAYNKTLFNDPIQKNAFKLKYKKDLLPPTTWKDVYEVASFFTQPKNKIYGICLQGAANGNWLYYEWMNFLFGNGGMVMNKDYGWQGDKETKILLRSKESLEAIKMYKSLKPFNYGGFTNIDAYEQIKVFKDNKIAFSFIWSDLAYSMIAKPNGQFDTNFGFSVIPGGKSILAGGSYFVNKKSKHPDKALKYILDIMQRSEQIKLTKKGLCSAMRTVYDDPEVAKIPYSQALNKSLERGVYMLEAGPDATIISEIITTYLQKYWNDELTAEKALEAMQNEIEVGRRKIFSSKK